jgi:hypothetical protein
MPECGDGGAGAAERLKTGSEPEPLPDPGSDRERGGQSPQPDGEVGEAPGADLGTEDPEGPNYVEFIHRKMRRG